MNTSGFAEKHRLKTRLDECGDKIIQGKRGHLYIAGGELCLMVTDGTVATSTRWKELGARSLWLGDISPNAKGVRMQDVKAAGISLENLGAALKLARIRRKRQASEAQLQAGRKGLEVLRRRKADIGRHEREAWVG